VESYVFSGPAIRRMSAEQFADALSAVTGVWAEKPNRDVALVVQAASAPARRSRAVQSQSQAQSTRSVVGTRAALVNANPLTVALGRPNREQVTTSRSAAATTLQALELANGATLADVLERGALKLLAEARTADRVIDLVYQRALGRAPTDAEITLCRSLVGGGVQTPTAAAVEDLLWAVVMLPEFQLLD
jgi:hypothetical protein